MDLAPIEALIEEMQEAEAGIADILEGWGNDYTDLELTPPADVVTAEQTAYFEKRNHLQREVLNAADSLRSKMNNLSDHGYPDIPVKQVPVDAYDDLAAQKRTIDAALATVAPMDPTTLVEGEVGPERPSS